MSIIGPLYIPIFCWNNRKMYSNFMLGKSDMIDSTEAVTELLFLGDVFLGKKYSAINALKDNAVVFNLESPISKRGFPLPGKINLRFEHDLLKSAFCPLPIAVCLANNHIMDYGNEAFEDTVKVLKDNDVSFFGAGRKTENYHNPLIISLNQLQVGFLGYCGAKYYEKIEDVKRLDYRPAPLKMDLIQRDIQDLKDNMVDKIIVQFHWGRLDCSLPKPEQAITAKKCIEMGADCIVGHHSHTVQPVEKYKQGIIAYGLGNFIFPDLNIPSYFDVAGIPSRRFCQKQRYWNKSSIGLLVNVASLDFSIRYFYFNGKTITEQRKRGHKYAHFRLPDDPKHLRSLIRRHLRVRRMIQLFLSFFDNPRIPKASTFKYLARCCKGIYD